MAVSEQLSNLAARAKKAEENVAAARDKARAQLEADVERAREAAQSGAVELRARMDADKGKVAAFWIEAQRAWNDNLDAKRSGSKRAARSTI
jgi:hypothetical protein